MRAPDSSGVYVISDHRGRCYVGSATRLSNRWSVHKATLNKGVHHNHRLQRAWDKYGSEMFSFKTLETCHRSEAWVQEQVWIDKLDPYYNLDRTAGSSLGRKLKNSARRAISEAQLRIGSDPAERKRRSDRAKAQHAAGKLGQATWSAETRARNSERMASLDRSVQVKALKNHWRKRSNRKRQSKKLHEYCSSHPEEMARRSRIRWSRL